MGLPQRTSGQGAGGCEVSVPSSAESSWKWAKLSGNGGMFPRSSVWTCFFAGPWSEHPMIDPGGDWGHPVACIKVLSGCILLTYLLLDSHCWGCRKSSLKEQCNCSSLLSGCSGLGNGEVCLWGLLEAWEGVLLACWCSVNGLCCCSLLLWPLLWGHELLDRESPLGCLAISFLLPSSEGDLAWDEEWAHEHLLPLNRDWAVAVALLRLTLTRHLLSSSCSLAIN